PDREVSLALHLAQQHDRVVRRHLDPYTQDVDLAHGFHTTPARTRSCAGRPGGQVARRPALTRVACRRTERAAISFTVSSARAWAAVSRPRLWGATTCATSPTSRSADVL